MSYYGTNTNIADLSSVYRRNYHHEALCLINHSKYYSEIYGSSSSLKKENKESNGTIHHWLVADI